MVCFWISKIIYEIKKCPEPESNQWHEDFQSSALPTELSGHIKYENSGDRIWTYDLRVMSPTSFQTAPPRDNKNKWAEVDSNHRSITQQIYSLSPLATRESTHFAKSKKPMIGLEPITCWLQISCSANWATSAYLIEMTPTRFELVLPPWKGDVLTAWPWGRIFKE